MIKGESVAVRDPEPEMLQWVALDRGNKNHVDNFKTLFRPILENAAFSMAQITDRDLEAPLSLVTTLPFFAVRGTDDLVGMIVLFNVNWIDGSAELGGSVFPAEQGKRWATTHVRDAIEMARKKLGLRRIYMNVLHESAGHAIAKSSGLVKEGTRRAARRTDDGFRDSHIYAWIEGD